jgi:hypothetical protein
VTLALRVLAGLVALGLFEGYAAWGGWPVWKMMHLVLLFGIIGGLVLDYLVWFAATGKLFWSPF